LPNLIQEDGDGTGERVKVDTRHLHRPIIGISDSNGVGATAATRVDEQHYRSDPRVLLSAVVASEVRDLSLILPITGRDLPHRETTHSNLMNEWTTVAS
jgi:hypothetical protein